MSVFEIVHQDQVQGKLTCFDRMIFTTSWPSTTPAACRPSSNPRA